MNRMLCRIISIISFVFAAMYFTVYVSLHFFISYNYFVDNKYYYIILLLMGIGSFVSTCSGFVFNCYKDLSLEELREKKNILLVWAAIFIFVCTACSILALVTIHLVCL